MVGTTYFSSGDSEDGLWTGYDWENTEQGIGVKNGVVYGLNDETQYRIEQARAAYGTMPNYSTSPNVERVKGFMSEARWDVFFPAALGVYTFENFLKAIAKFPYFCNDVSPDSSLTLDEACKREVATLLAHIKHESGSLRYVKEIACSGSDASTNPNCNYATTAATNPRATTIWPPQEGKQYYGRGAFQLSWNYNYGMFSDIAYDGGLDNKMNLLKDPDQVATNGFYAFSSALWFYMTP